MTEDLERRLRRALADDASSITPTDRRRSIEAMVHDDAATPSGTRRWSGRVASAAAVAVIAALAWGATGALRPPGDRTTTAATTGTPDAATSATPSPAAPSTGPEPSAPVPATPASPAVPTPAATATARSVPCSHGHVGPLPTATSMPSAGSSAPRGAGTLALLPVYLVGPVGGDGTGQRYGLFRELVRAALPTGTTPAQKAQAALTVAMAATAGDAGTPYPRPWSGTTVSGVTVADGAITVALSDAGPSGLPAEQSRLAVQELVWTATAAVGNATFPVRFSVPGATALLGSYPTGAAYSRPAADATYQDLAPIWVESPSAGAVLRPTGRWWSAARPRCSRPRFSGA